MFTLTMHHMDADKGYGEKARRQLHKNATSYIEQIPEATSYKTITVRPPTTHLENHSKLNKQDMLLITGEVRTNS